MSKTSYENVVSTLIRVIDIAKEVISLSDLHSDIKKKQLEWGDKIKEMLLNLEPQYQTVASVKQLEKTFLVYWNEDHGEHIESFWRKVANCELSIEREDLIKKIIRRKKISNHFEYDLAIDYLGEIAKKGGANANKDITLLNKFIKAFEDKYSI